MRPVRGLLPLKLPVIVMNGAALYDINENSFLFAYVISPETCAEVHSIVLQRGMNMFTNALCDDNLVIYYDLLKNDAEKAIYSSLKKSPYRSYVNRTPPDEDRSIYLMIVDESERISGLYYELLEKFGDKLKIITYPSTTIPATAI